MPFSPHCNARNRAEGSNAMYHGNHGQDSSGRKAYVTREWHGDDGDAYRQYRKHPCGEADGSVAICSCDLRLLSPRS